MWGLNPSKKLNKRSSAFLVSNLGKISSFLELMLPGLQNPFEVTPKSFHLAQGKSDVLYNYYLLDLHPVLVPIATRVIYRNAQYEEAVMAYTSSKVQKSGNSKRREMDREIRLITLESLLSVFMPKDCTVARVTEETECNKAKADSLHDKNIMVSIMDAMKRAKERIKNHSVREKRSYYRK